jgi:hypothetical protein
MNDDYQRGFEKGIETAVWIMAAAVVIVGGVILLINVFSK